MAAPPTTITQRLKDEKYNRTQFGADLSTFLIACFSSFGINKMFIAWGADEDTVDALSTLFAAIITYIITWSIVSWWLSPRRGINATGEAQVFLPAELKARDEARAHLDTNFISLPNIMVQVLLPAAFVAIVMGLIIEHSKISEVGEDFVSAMLSATFAVFMSALHRKQVNTAEAIAVEQYRKTLAPAVGAT